MTYELARLVHLWRQAHGLDTTPIPDELINAEKIVELLDEEIEQEYNKPEPDNLAVQQLEARRVLAKRILANLENKYNLK